MLFFELFFVHSFQNLVKNLEELLEVQISMVELAQSKYNSCRDFLRS
jgi:hypothetical protein